jgi:hypothetical protein
MKRKFNSTHPDDFKPSAINIEHTPALYGRNILRPFLGSKCRLEKNQGKGLNLTSGVEQEGMALLPPPLFYFEDD